VLDDVVDLAGAVCSSQVKHSSTAKFQGAMPNCLIHILVVSHAIQEGLGNWAIDLLKEFLVSV
jgi:hypothetical protein